MLHLRSDSPTHIQCWRSAISFKKNSLYGWLTYLECCGPHIWRAGIDTWILLPTTSRRRYQSDQSSIHLRVTLPSRATGDKGWTKNPPGTIGRSSSKHVHSLTNSFRSSASWRHDLSAAHAPHAGSWATWVWSDRAVLEFESYQRWIRDFRARANEAATTIMK